jgi:metal-sulfur cluster biosynthetic enzyme
LVLSGNENVAATAWQTARSIAANITNPNWRARALSEIGQAMVQARHEQEAREIWQEAQVTIASIEDIYWKSRQTGDLAKKMIQTGLWREYVSLLGNADTNNNKLGELGTKLIEAGKLQEAQEVLAAMPAGSWDANKLAGELSRAFIQQDDFQEAREILDSITDNSQRIQALSEFGQAMARTHYELEARQILQEVRDLLTTIEDSTQESNPLAPIPISQRAKDLSILGQAMAQAGYRQEALLVWQEARELIQTLADSSEKVKELSKIGLVMAQANYGQEALLVWQEARAITSTIKEYSEKVNTLSELGQTMAQANHEQEAWQIWQEALAIITSTDERIAGVFDSLDETNMGKEQQEQKKAATRENYLKGARAMRKGGQMLAQDYQRQDLRELMGYVGEEIEAFFNLFMEPEERERTNMQGAGPLLGSLMVGLAFNSVSPEALSRFSQVLAEAEHWQEAREVLMTIEDHPLWQDHAWEALAGSLTRAECWQEACDAATAIKDSWKRISMQNEIVKVLAQKKQWQLAWKTLATIEDGDKRTEALRELSSAVMQFYNEVHQEVAFVYRNPLPEQDMSPEQERQRTDVWRYDDYQQLLTVLLQVWTAVTTSEEALAAFPLAHGFVQRSPELGRALVQGFTWVSDFLQSGYEVSL